VYKYCSVCSLNVLTVVTERQIDCSVECVIVQHNKCTGIVQFRDDLC